VIGTAVGGNSVRDKPLSTDNCADTALSALINDAGDRRSGKLLAGAAVIGQHSDSAEIPVLSPVRVKPAICPSSL
jgi:hypothetical protein